MCKKTKLKRNCTIEQLSPTSPSAESRGAAVIIWCFEEGFGLCSKVWKSHVVNLISSVPSLRNKRCVDAVGKFFWFPLWMSGNMNVSCRGSLRFPLHKGDFISSYNRCCSYNRCARVWVKALHACRIVWNLCWIHSSLYPPVAPNI